MARSAASGLEHLRRVNLRQTEVGQLDGRVVILVLEEQVLGLKE